MSFFKEYEKKFNFKDYTKKIRDAKERGFETFIEYVIYAYKVSKSMNDTAKRCDLTFGTTKNILNNIPDAIKKELGIKIRSKGGRSWSKFSDDDVRYIRSKRFMNISKYIKLAEELSEKISKERGVDIVIGWKDIERCYTKKTHKNIV